jgi:hypothetical protein
MRVECRQQSPQDNPIVGTMSFSGSELVGNRARGQTLVGQLPPGQVVALWSGTASAVVKRGFVLEYRDLEPPRTGIFDGLTIVIDPDVGLEMQCFVLLHLFGHSVQWVAPSLEHKLTALQHTSDKAGFLEVLRNYEYEAANPRGPQQFHSKFGGLDQWYSDFVATDWRYVERYYLEDRIPPWEECIVTGAPLVRPRSIPPLEHKRVEVRFAF